MNRGKRQEFKILPENLFRLFPRGGRGEELPAGIFESGLDQEPLKFFGFTTATTRSDNFKSLRVVNQVTVNRYLF